MMSKFIVSVTDCRHKSYDVEKEILNSIGAEIVLNNCQTEIDLLEACLHSDAILLDGAPMTRSVIKRLEQCKIINRYGIGYDNLDVDTCTEMGIWASNVPDYCIHDVAEHAIGLMLSCMRQIPYKDKGIREGKWNFSYPSIYRLAHKNLGVIGAGKIGKSFIDKTRGFSFENTFVFDQYKSEEEISSWGCIKTDLDELLSSSDIVTLHVPLNPETYYLINSGNIQKLKPSAILINTSRGKLVDTKALFSALANNQILCAGLDTHEIEPLPDDSDFYKLHNVVLTDHCAYSSEEAIFELKTKSAINIKAVLSGRQPEYALNRIKTKKI